MTADTAPDDRDQLTRFLIEGAGVRGVRVHLHDTWQQIRGHLFFAQLITSSTYHVGQLL